MSTGATATTAGIRISVKTHYEERFSSPHNLLFLFSYEITIENTNSFSVQLLRRSWNIFDSSFDKRQVRGMGVVGEQPIISSGEQYTYRSSCDFSTEVGKMAGTFQMMNLETQKKFRVKIPSFSMIRPIRLN